MNIEELLVENKGRKAVMHIEIEDIKYKYPEYEIFIPVSDPDFVILRKKVGESIFGDKPKFPIGIYKDIKIHYTQLYMIS